MYLFSCRSLICSTQDLVPWSGIQMEGAWETCFGSPESWPLDCQESPHLLPFYLCFSIFFTLSCVSLWTQNTPPGPVTRDTFLGRIGKGERHSLIFFQALEAEQDIHGGRGVSATSVQAALDSRPNPGSTLNRSQRRLEPLQGAAAAPRLGAARCKLHAVRRCWPRRNPGQAALSPHHSRLSNAFCSSENAFS